MAEPDGVPWLDEHEQAVWLGLVGLLIHLPAALDAQLRRDSQLSHFEYQVLAALSASDAGTLRMTDIAAFTEGSLSRLSHASKRLEAQGWIERRADPDDGRATLATLTEAGLAKIVEAAPGHVRAVRQLVFDPLTAKQREQLGEIARRVGYAIERSATEGA